MCDVIDLDDWKARRHTWAVATVLLHDETGGYDPQVQVEWATTYLLTMARLRAERIVREEREASRA